MESAAIYHPFRLQPGAAWMVNGLLMTAAPVGAPIPVYYADYQLGTLTPAAVTVLTTEDMLAHIYTCGQKCFALTSHFVSNG